MINMHDLRHSDGRQDDLSVDVAIVGAGVSGLYSGFRLLGGDFEDGAEPPKSVHIFEMSDRVGGRLESMRLPRSGVIGELGGMRFFPTQEIVYALIDKELKIPKHSFPLGDDARHFVYLRGQRFRADAWARAQANGERFKTRYELGEDLDGFSPRSAIEQGGLRRPCERRLGQGELR